MSADQERLYKVKKQDIRKTGRVLGNAFMPDPVWKEVMKDIPTEQIYSFFEGPARYGLRYGTVYASSESLEGIATWVPGNHADMNFWRGFLSGSFISGLKIGMKNLMRMMPVFQPLETDRRKHMAGRSYIYLMVIGVAPEFQGQGYGKTLLNELIRESEASRLPVYLETSTEKNVSMYERFGFKVLDKFLHPIIDLPQWKMLREPGESNQR